MGKQRLRRMRLLFWICTIPACLLTLYLGSFHLSTIFLTSELPTPRCRCNIGGAFHDFCYRLPFQPQVRGLPFNCSLAAYLKRLDLLSSDRGLDIVMGQMPDPMFITAMSENHFEEGLTLIANIRKFWPHERILVYDLGLSLQSVEELKNKCLVELQNFPFSEYPSYVKNLLEYRWKPLIIAMAVMKFGAIWWMDTSVRWKKDYRKLVYDEIRCRNGSITQAVQRFRSANFFNNMNITLCGKSGFLLQSPSGHSIFATTNPGVYKYIPTVLRYIKSKSCENYDANFAFIVRSKNTLNILKWWVLCALEKDCMAPPGSQRFCNFGSDRFMQYAECHRYDQSVINLLLANAYGYNPKNYVSRFGEDGVAIQRYATNSLTAEDFLCN